MCLSKNGVPVVDSLEKNLMPLSEKAGKGRLRN